MTLFGTVLIFYFGNLRAGLYQHLLRKVEEDSLRELVAHIADREATDLAAPAVREVVLCSAREEISGSSKILKE